MHLGTKQDSLGRSKHPPCIPLWSGLFLSLSLLLITTKAQTALYIFSTVTTGYKEAFILMKSHFPPLGMGCGERQIYCGKSAKAGHMCGSYMVIGGGY